MTIKHMNKNISAEKAQVVTNITSSPNGLLVTKTNLHDETSVSDAIDLTGTKLHLMILNNNNDLDLLGDCDTDNKLETLNNYFEGEYQISFDSLAQLNDYIQSKMFLVEDSTSEEEDNIYNEYIWMNGDFELIGTTKIDLTNYIQKSNGTNLLLTDGTNIAQSTFAQATALTDKEDTSNKSSSIVTDTGSTNKYPTVKAVEDYAVQKIPMGDVYGVGLNSTSLQKQIQNASSGNTIVLDKDYLNNSSASSIALSNKNITIIGNGHIIDGNNKMITFSASGTTTLKISNCVFQNLNFNSGMTLFQAIDSAKIILDNCIFKNIKNKTNGGIIDTNQSLGNYTYTNAEIKILNSSFLSITGGTFLNFCDTNFSIINTIFENNATDSILVNNTSSTNFIQEIINCVFNNNYQAIADSSTGTKSLVLKNNHFLQSGDTVTGCVNNNYLTSHQDISGKEDTSNKVTTMSSSSTNTQYPSAKAVYDALPKTTKTLTVTYTNGTTEDIEFYIR